MRVWLITVGEPLPIDGADVRLLRTGYLAQQFAASGDHVTWWSSTFNHAKKCQRQRRPITKLSPNFDLRLLRGMSYKKNTSIRRILNHRSMATQFTRVAPTLAQPDLILCSFPTIELSRAAIDYALPREIPVFLDVRDLWPDIFLDLVPRMIRPIARTMLAGLYRDAEHALCHCKGIIAISENYLHWGLAKADRRQGRLDAVFPLAYQERSGSPRAPHTWIRDHGIDPDKFIVWFIGSFGRTYDLGTVIRAARQLHEEGRTDLQFVLSGDGPFYSKWVTQAHGLPNVTFTGWIDGQGISALMDAAAVGLMSYAKGAPQGLPNKLFEYLSAGIPILSSLGAETQALVVQERCGVSYEAENVDSLLRGLEALASPEARRAMGERGRRVFEECYSAGAVYQAMIDHLRNAVIALGNSNDSRADVADAVVRQI